ncbi:MAG: metallophosphoesterase [Alphaproteobacteria bacterium]
MKAIQFNTTIKANVPLKFALFSDIHGDSPEFDKVSFIEHASYCLKDQRYMLFGGDMFDAIIRTDHKRAVNSLLEKGDNQLNIKLDKLYELLKPYQKQILFFGRGNHEESVLKYNGIDLLEVLAKMLNVGREHKIVVGNYANFIRFNFQDSRGKSVAHYDIFQHHGMGASAPVTKGMIDFNRIAKGVNADLIWCGHKHQAVIDASDPIMYVAPNGNVILKNRQCIMTPSYQKGRTIDPNVNFAERMYSHTAISGFGQINLTPVCNGKGGYQILSDIKLTNRPMQILGQIQSAKIR